MKPILFTFAFAATLADHVVPSPPHWRVGQVAGHGMGAAAALEDVADHRQDVWWAHQIEFDQEH